MSIYSPLHACSLTHALMHVSCCFNTLQVLSAQSSLTTMIMYCSLLKIRPWAMNLSGCSKRGVGIFSRTLSLKNRPSPFDAPMTVLHSSMWAVWYLQLFMMQRLEKLRKCGTAPYSDAPCMVVSLASTSLTWSDRTAPKLHLLQLLFPDCIRFVPRMCSFSCCSPTASSSAAAVPVCPLVITHTQ